MTALRALTTMAAVFFVMARTAAAQPPAPSDHERTLFQSDMSVMAGMAPRDSRHGPARPGWTAMTMGIVRLGYNRQGGPSGGRGFESTNWMMAMAQRDLGRGRLTLMAMSSLEPATLPERGARQLFQVGETFGGRPLVDRQHPHDFVMNLSATYRVAVGSEGAAWVQVAPRGEPALGPTAFMHRASAGEHPAAVLGHHQHDSTHITDGVITLGGGWRRLTVEGSAFHGAEPDEGRWDLDPGGLDSVSGRVKLDLGRGWSGQASYGFLHEPEALEPGDTRRTTASLHYGAAGDRPLAVSLVWGRNREDHGRFRAALLEAAYQLTRADQLFARAEQADRDAHLLREKDLPHDDDGHEDLVAVRALTVGYLRRLRGWEALPVLGPLDAGLGATLTAHGFPRRLDDSYGKSPLGVQAFLRLRWGRPHSAAHAH